MKGLLKRLKNNNVGNTFVVVVVTVSFLMIISAALISTVATVYYSKIYDYNARDNFHYVEQAMDEVYATIGSTVAEQLKEAYNYTLQHMITIDPTTNEYKTIDNDEANKMFKEKFMANVMSSDYFKTSGTGTFVDLVEGQISNNTVKLDPANLSVEYMKLKDPDDESKGSEIVVTPGTTDVISKVIIKNVTLYRTAKYNNGNAGGNYTQTISTDIAVDRPPFKVDFGDSSYALNNLFDYTIIADSGVEVNEPRGKVLAISGDVYAASDFYNKKYNGYDSDTSSDVMDKLLKPSFGGQTYQYKLNKVSSYDGTSASMYNKNARVKGTEDPADTNYDGIGDRSKYSGFYVNGTRVSVMANNFIVPGSISVMNAGDLNVYGISTSSNNSQIWADNVFLGGGNVGTTGSSALFNADMHIRDDMSLDAKNTSVKLVGNYYGYSNGSTDLPDNRYFVPTVGLDNNSTTQRNLYYEKTRKVKTNSLGEVVTEVSNGVEIPVYERDSEGNYVYVYKNRGHYNSSAIVVNGENANINLADTGNVYLAGRSYIELSRQVKSSTTKTVDLNTTDTLSTTVEKYHYDADINDYKTGESLSVANAQFAYEPFRDVVEVKDTAGKVTHYESQLPTDLNVSGLFKKYFKNYEHAGYIPVTKQTEEVTLADGSKVNKVYTYIDFEYMAKNNSYDHDSFYDSSDVLLNSKYAGMSEAEMLATSFIKDYYYYLVLTDEKIYLNTDPVTNTVTFNGVRYEDVDTTIFAPDNLTDKLKAIAADEDFAAGNIKLPTVNTTSSRGNVFASGTLAKSLVSTDADYDFTFSVETRRDTNVKGAVKEIVSGSEVYTNKTTADAVKAAEMSKSFYDHYNYVKWALKDVTSESLEGQTVDNYIMSEDELGEGAITPINNFMNFDLITDKDMITPTNFNLGTYRVWVSNDDVEVSCKSDGSDNHEITGIIITKGDVYFNGEGTGAEVVNKFNGLIICGGKVYVNGDVTEICSSVLCKKIIETCIDRRDDPTDGSKAQLFLKLFKAYEKSAASSTTSSDVVDINNINYKDFLGYEHWMKNVESGSH